eukprot:5543863-Ditylum_brightwellii.AAC.1
MSTNNASLKVNTPKPPMIAAIVPTLPAEAVAVVGQYTSWVQWLQYKMPEPPNITTLPRTVIELGNEKTAYSKRQYIYSKASMRSNEFDSRGVNEKQMLIRASTAMDMECGTMTMA